MILRKMRKCFYIKDIAGLKNFNSCDPNSPPLPYIFLSCIFKFFLRMNAAGIFDEYKHNFFSSSQVLNSAGRIYHLIF